MRQMALPGFEGCTILPRLSHSARRTLEVIQGYSRGAWGFCAAFQRTLARVLRRSIRSVARSLDELRRAGAILIQHHGPRASSYHVQNERVAELLAELSRPHLNIESEAESSRGEHSTVKTTPSVPLGYPEGVRVLLGMCFAHGKMISRPDQNDASAAWIGAQIDLKGIALQVQSAYFKACQEASAPRYVPAPAPWLRAEGWTRCEVEPVCQPKSKLQKAWDGAMDILNRRAGS